jgi:thymidylate synthase (FAD)
MNEHRLSVLDHGFVELRNLAGQTRRMWAPTRSLVDGIEVDLDLARSFDADDVDPANAARMSFDQMDKGRTRQKDLDLCNYLMKNRHTSPFEMIECWVEMKMPIFVARQFVRHRTVSINEVSGRYVTLPAEWYIPEVVGAKPDIAKQGQVDKLPPELQHEFKMDLDEDCQRSYNKYIKYIELGVAPEHARMWLHLNHYTHWLWKQDLHNIMHFLSLRDHSHAQIEAQAYAKAIDVLLREQLPNTMSLYDKYRKLEA